MPDPTVFIIDDDDAVLDSLSVLLETGGFSVKGFASANAFLAVVQESWRGCILTDVRMPGMDGLELQEKVAEQGLNLPVVVMTGHGDVPIAVRAMKAGAIDFIQKPFDEEMILDSIRRALDLSEQVRSREAASGKLRGRLATLTIREREVLNNLVDGHPNKVIAFNLGISPRTVEIHRARVMEKMQARSLSELVRMTLSEVGQPA